MKFYTYIEAFLLGHLRHVENVLQDLQIGGRNRSQRPLHSSEGKFHCRHEWRVERSRTHASRLQRDSALRRSGRQQTSRRICHLFGTVARRRHGVLGFEKEHGKGGGSRARFVLRSLDTGSLYETRRSQREVVAHVSGRMSGIGRRLGRRIRGIIYEVRIGVSLFIYHDF